MPISAADRTLLETHPHRAKFSLVIHQPDTVLAARVNGAPSGDPITTITFDNVTAGAWGNVEAGQTLLLGSSIGDHDRATVRVRSATSTVLTIAESSDLLHVQDNDFITILREHRFWLKFPRLISATEIYEDYDVAWTSEDVQFGPISMMGPCGFAFLDDATVDLEYDFTASYAIAGASIDTYAATFQHGDGGSAATGTHTETYSAATGMAGSETKLVVTDDNGVVAMGWRYDFILSRSGANAPITNWFINSPIRGGWEGNDALDFTLYGDAAQTVLRDGTRVWIIFESWYGDTQKEISLEYTNRANILFEGWIVKDSIERHADHSTVRFTARPITKEIDDGKSFPGTLEIKTSPSIWYEVSTCTTVKAALYLCKWRSTLAEIVDIVIPSSPTSTSGQDWSSGSLLNQLKDALEDDLLSVVQHKSGMIYFEKHASLMSTSERASLELTMIVESNHWRIPLSVPEEITDQLSHVLFGGVYFDGVDGYPYFSEAPGIASKYRGRDGGKIDGLALISQDHINQMSGDYLAMRNAKYPKVPVDLTGFWSVVDCVPQRRYRIGMGASMNIRGVSISGKNFIPRAWSIDVSQQDGIGMSSVDFEVETDGEDGQSVTYVIEPPTTNYIPTPGNFVPPYSPPTRLPIDTGGRFLATSLGVYVTDKISSPAWYSTNYGLSGDALTVWSLRRDPWHWYSSDDNDKTMWATTQDGIYKMVGFPSGTWVQVISIAAITTACGFGTDLVQYGRMSMSIEKDGRYVFVFQYPGGFGASRTWAIVCQDSTILYAVNYRNANYTQYWPDVRYGQHSGALKIFVTATAQQPGTGPAIWKSVDGGASYNLIDSLVTGGSQSYVSVPYDIAGNTGDLYVVWGSDTEDPRKSIDGGVSFSDLGTGTLGFSQLHNGGVSGNKDLLWLNSINHAATVQARWSGNGGILWNLAPWRPQPSHRSVSSYATWEEESVLVSVTMGNADAATSDLIMYWQPGDAAWTDKTGNLGAFGSMAIYDILGTL